MILANVHVLTHPDADAIVARKGRIEAIGLSGGLDGVPEPGEEQVDAEGGIALPGFVDSHVHLFHTGLLAIGARVDLSDRARHEVIAALAAAAHERDKGEWVVGSGWDETRWDEPTYLRRAELDVITTDRPVIAIRMDLHLIIANTVALRRAESMLPPHVARRLVDARRGEIREAAAWHLIEALEPDQSTMEEALEAAVRVAHRQGVTSIHAMMPRRRVPILRSSYARHKLRINVYHRISSPAEIAEVDATPIGDGRWVRFGGVKAFADGSLGAKNAAVGEPYRGGGRGQLNHEADAMRAMLAEAEARRWPTAIHAIGDRAIEQVLAAHEDVGSSRALRHRIEHAELIAPEHIARARDQGVTLSMQPNFIGNWSGENSMNERRLGRLRDERSNPMRWVLDGGAQLAFGSDGMPLSPLYGLRSAVCAPHPAQRISMEEAITAYTRGGAWLSFEEEQKGRLDVGCLADIVVLNVNPFEDPSALDEDAVRMVFVGGECVYDAQGRVR